MKDKRTKLYFASIFKINRTFRWWEILGLLFGAWLVLILAAALIVLIFQFFAPDISAALGSFFVSLRKLPLKILEIPLCLSLGLSLITAILTLKEFIYRHGYIKECYPDFEDTCIQVNSDTGLNIEPQKFFVWCTRNKDRTFYFSKIETEETVEYIKVKEMLDKINDAYASCTRREPNLDSVCVSMIHNDRPHHIAQMYVIYAYATERKWWWDRNGYYYYDINHNKIYYTKELGFFYM